MNSLVAQPPRHLHRIAALVRRLATESEGEALATVRALRRTLKTHRADFNDLADLINTRTTPEWPTPDLRVRLGQCLGRLHVFDERQRDFLLNIRDLLGAGHELSEKQVSWINGLHKRLLTSWRTRSAA